MPARPDTITMPKREVLSGKTWARVAKRKGKRRERPNKLTSLHSIIYDIGERAIKQAPRTIVAQKEMANGPPIHLTILQIL